MGKVWAWEWLDESRTIAIISMRGDWAPGYLKDYASTFWPQMEQQPHTVDVIVDLRGPGFIPLQPVTSLIWIAKNRPANAGRVVFIVRRALGLAMVRALSQTVQRLYPQFQLFGALTREEAVQLLRPSTPAARDLSPIALAEAGSQFPSESPR